MTFSEQSALFTPDLSRVRKQKTLTTRLDFSGIGVFTGKSAIVRICPAEAGFGIVFQRVDLPGKPLIPADIAYLSSSPRCTKLVKGEASVQTVEHLLAALRAFEIDNALIEISGPEVPILDGSALAYSEALEQAAHKGEIALLDDDKPVFKLSAPVYYTHESVQMIALPSEEYRISYTVDYPHASHIGTHYFSVAVNAENFKNEIASARTFCLYEELAPLLKSGMLQEINLSNGVVVDEKGVMNPEGLRYHNEFARHKILDIIGDLSLTGLWFTAHVIAIKSGHAANHLLGLELRNQFNTETS